MHFNLKIWFFNFHFWLPVGSWRTHSDGWRKLTTQMAWLDYYKNYRLAFFCVWHLRNKYLAVLHIEQLARSSSLLANNYRRCYLLFWFCWVSFAYLYFEQHHRVAVFVSESGIRYLGGRARTGINTRRGRTWVTDVVRFENNVLGRRGRWELCAWQVR